MVKKLEQAARRLAKCVNYVGAATVEYLYSMDTGEYYFLELNPQLQNTVTEWIAEINLPAAQVAMGMGIPLWRIPGGNPRIQKLVADHPVIVCSAAMVSEYALDDVGSGSHVHLSLWENGKDIFMASGGHSKHGMSKVGEEFMAGVLNHLPSILAFTAPLPNRRNLHWHVECAREKGFTFANCAKGNQQYIGHLCMILWL
ncbi:Acetyl-CoA carboxylase 1 [Camellia lanceoleosa]|uniref:Acetyl-CoA carboxylase 1 n=1 Tax=Camellia lanceoleosa TaxID=1840588 RepID=A0ACC0I5N0_9ERIC|nr:Acetyl-CoA carboxylase 1 [Camellia lanceoleosa]